MARFEDVNASQLLNDKSHLKGGEKLIEAAQLYLSG